MTVAEILEQAEGATLDFKRDLSSLDKVIKAIVAIANTANGTVVVGVDDDKVVRGLSEPLKDEERVARAVADSIEPLLLVDIRHATADGAALLIVEVPFTPRPYFLKQKGIPD